MLQASPSLGWKLTHENFLHSALIFRERQAGIGLVFNPETELFSYNVYCVETKLMVELMTCEFTDIDEALATVNSEFETWEYLDMQKKEGCGTCVAK